MVFYFYLLIKKMSNSLFKVARLLEKHIFSKLSLRQSL